MTITTKEVPQYMRALAIGNEKRIARAGLKRRIHAGDNKLFENLLHDCPDVLCRSYHGMDHSLLVIDLLTWQRWWGEKRAKKLCEDLEIGHTVELHHLTPQRREELIAALRAMR